ncbi:MAG: AraC family transcriptional regulator [Woeseiaceae bacterium]|nr:AraC family transcriptional regulator [Woeseiaceae bacterium]
MTKTIISLLAAAALAFSVTAVAQEAGTGNAGASEQFRGLDQDVQTLKKEVLDLNRDLFLLEEELLFPANSQVAFFLSMDVGEYFELDSVNIKIDGKEVANYLYTTREAEALVRGGVQRVHMANLKTGDHELVAVFIGKGPHVRDYRRGATLNFNKGIGAKYVELEITDRVKKQQPEFVIKEWE